jgi:hypothetical protein
MRRIPDWLMAVAVVGVIVAVCLTMAILFPVTGNAQTASGTDRWFAEGNTLPEFETYYAIQNPGGEQARVLFQFQFEDGQCQVFAVNVPASSRFTVRLADIVPAGHSGVSAHVYSDQEVVVERSIYFTYKNKWKGGSTSSGQSALQTKFYFAEGTTRNNQADGSFDTWLCLANPNGGTATVSVAYLLTTGQTVNKPYSVPPHSRRTVDIATDVGLDQDCGIVVTSSVPIACERPMYYEYHGTVQDGSSVVGAPEPETKWYFAEGTTRVGFDEWLTVLNPSDRQAQVTVRYLLAGGGGLNPQVMLIGPRSRRTINVNAEAGPGLDLSMVVESDVPVVAERSVYANTPACYGGDSGMGTTSPATEWQFAEGNTLQGFTTYYTLLNANNTTAKATITYAFKDGSVQQRQLTLPANSRTTLNIADDVGNERDVAGSITSTLPIVAERPMYFSSRWRGETVSAGTSR